MTAGSSGDDFGRPGDALDGTVDEALGSAMRAHTVDLRDRVLARIDEPAGASPTWRRFVLRPALLPAAGAVLLVVGVVLTWQHVDGTLSRIGSRQPVGSIARPGHARSPAPLGKSATVPAPEAPPSATRERASTPGSAIAAARPAPVPRTAATEGRVAAASVFQMDAMSAPSSVGAETVIAGDDAKTAGQPVPGAIGGDLGDPITPIPTPPPIVIPPISLVPIVEAPPVSTLTPPVSTVPTVGEIPRDPSGPGKSGGDRP